MRIIVIGGGLAGLSVAISLAQGGHDVEILESAPAITYIGAGIQVSSNSSLILRRLGIDKYIEKYCTEPVDLRMMRWKDGNLLVECPLKEPAQKEYNSPYWHIHRADLHRGLLEAALDRGCKLHLNSRVVSIDPDAGSLLTQDGTTYSADFIVASDGLHSMARSIVLGKPGPPIPTGQMAYRVTLPAAKLRGIPELEEIITVPRNNHWLGPHGTILSYLLEGQNEPLINFVFTCDVNEVDLPPGVDQRMGTAEEVRNSFKGWDPRIEKMLEYVEDVLYWRLYTHAPLATWSHPSHRLVLIGDAAHAMTPYLAQGAAMSIEDAAILVLSLYERLRIDRVTKVASASVESRWFTQMEDGDKQRERDAWLLLHPGIEPGHINLRSDKLWLDELFGYDAYQVLDEVLSEASS
ncbi:hypothetical protein BDP27DRAFT_1332328 [Rhodocollybia butyracea]|uniref:FAD-binding domain-containing protein n=1 Tax=Rhodocollybia butyracea TaxID=206335 RepID=A0A9P5U2X9_9AGAR|nr:hypothetical protein BDP27DRAFT_1332328 [Rhodocollybia butyracea]